MLLQRTIKNIVSTSGVGLHAGGRVNITFKPAPVNTGIVFSRSDINTNSFIKLSPKVVINTRMATVISNGEISISTVEHVLSACCGLAIDNLYIEVSSAEIPIMDGSAAPFVYLLQSAQIIKQNVAKKWLAIKNTVRIEEGDKFAEISPYQGFKLDFTIDFKHPALNKTPKNFSLDFGKDSYIETISKARTFGFTHEIEALRQAGLARGGSIDNVIVMDEYRILNNDTMRYTDEFVRHKVLDAIGDLYVAGYPILGYYNAFKSGHALNNQLLRKVFAEQAYEIIEINQEQNKQDKLTNWLNDGLIDNVTDLNFN
ncbi:MAG: UDP-3-O-acyl-N-acetylglucosamine deacetylase [Pseudomonadota bacterium]|jgi:UDP-3-O-[3-hydroxymyristoyl] N-acetylglucosamine deacetylase